MLKNNEKNLLRFIKYSPIIFISILAILANILVHVQNEINLNKQISQAKDNFFQTKKLLVKKEVDKVYENILIQRASIEDDLKQSIKERVYTAYSIANNLYENYKHLGDEKALEIIKDALRDIRFNEGRGYYFIDSIDGVKQLQPINPAIEGGNYLEYKDAKGYQFVKTISQTIKDKTERFDEYYWPKPGNPNKSFKKISFYKSFAPLNIAIGAGEYLDDFTQSVKQHLLYEYIKRISFDNDGFVSVYKYSGENLVHHYTGYQGVNFLEWKDHHGTKAIAQIIQLAKHTGGYYQFTEPEHSTSPKTVYVRGLDDWQWVIVAGFYADELNENIEKRELNLEVINNEYRKKIIIVSILITIILLAGSVSISRLLQNYFKTYHQLIQKKSEESREKDSILYQQSKMAAMGEMLANIAHQWRQPLSLITTIATSIQLQKELNILSNKDEKKALGQIVENAQYLSHTIDDFRDFFKPDKEKAYVDIKNVLDKALMLTSTKLHNKEIELIMDVNSFEMMILENELVQVLINLISNAEDVLKQREQSRYIFITTRLDEKKLSISIKDNGGGIDKEVIQRIFEPYFTTKHQAQGTGLGLYMVKQIIQRHMSGSIEVYNRHYEYKEHSCVGAEFIITLPIEQKA